VAERSLKRLLTIPHQKAIGIIGRCDSELSSPHLFFGLSQVELFIKQDRLKWVVEGEIARKTYLWDERKPARRRLTGEWIPMPSPAPPDDWCGPISNVLQFV